MPRTTKLGHGPNSLKGVDTDLDGTSLKRPAEPAGIVAQLEAGDDPLNGEGGGASKQQQAGLPPSGGGASLGDEPAPPQKRRLPDEFVADL